MVHTSTLASAQPGSQQPAHWPFGKLDEIQLRNHMRCHDAVRRLEQHRAQQRLQECIEACREVLS